MNPHVWDCNLQVIVFVVAKHILPTLTAHITNL